MNGCISHFMTVGLTNICGFLKDSGSHSVARLNARTLTPSSQSYSVNSEVSYITKGDVFGERGFRDKRRRIRTGQVRSRQTEQDIYDIKHFLIPDTSATLLPQVEVVPGLAGSHHSTGTFSFLYFLGAVTGTVFSL